MFYIHTNQSITTSLGPGDGREVCRLTAHRVEQAFPRFLVQYSPLLKKWEVFFFWAIMRWRKQTFPLQFPSCIHSSIIYFSCGSSFRLLLKGDPVLSFSLQRGVLPARLSRRLPAGRISFSSEVGGSRALPVFADGALSCFLQRLCSIPRTAERAGPYTANGYLLLGCSYALG